MNTIVSLSLFFSGGRGAVIFDAIGNLLRDFLWCTQMMEKLEDTLSAIEGNVALRLDRIDHRLDSMEQLVGFRILVLPFRGPAGQKITQAQQTICGLS